MPVRRGVIDDADSVRSDVPVRSGVPAFTPPSAPVHATPSTAAPAQRPPVPVAPVDAPRADVAPAVPAPTPSSVPTPQAQAFQPPAATSGESDGAAAARRAPPRKEKEQGTQRRGPQATRARPRSAAPLFGDLNAQGQGAAQGDRRAKPRRGQTVPPPGAPPPRTGTNAAEVTEEMVTRPPIISTRDAQMPPLPRAAGASSLFRGVLTPLQGGVARQREPTEEDKARDTRERQQRNNSRPKRTRDGSEERGTTAERKRRRGARPQEEMEHAAEDRRELTPSPVLLPEQPAEDEDAEGPEQPAGRTSVLTEHDMAEEPPIPSPRLPIASPLELEQPRAAAAAAALPPPAVRVVEEEAPQEVRPRDEVYARALAVLQDNADPHAIPDHRAEMKCRGVVMGLRYSDLVTTAEIDFQEGSIAFWAHGEDDGSGPQAAVRCIIRFSEVQAVGSARMGSMYNVAIRLKTATGFLAMHVKPTEEDKCCVQFDIDPKWDPRECGVVIEQLKSTLTGTRTGKGPSEPVGDSRWKAEGMKRHVAELLICRTRMMRQQLQIKSLRLDNNYLKGEGLERLSRGQLYEFLGHAINAVNEIGAEAKQRDDLCLCCSSNTVNTVLLPCKHLLTCESCFRKMARQGQLNCPMCRREVVDHMVVYLR